MASRFLHLVHSQASICTPVLKKSGSGINPFNSIFSPQKRQDFSSRLGRFSSALSLSSIFSRRAFNSSAFFFQNIKASKISRKLIMGLNKLSMVDSQLSIVTDGGIGVESTFLSRSSNFLCQTSKPLREIARAGNGTQVIRYRKQPVARLLLGSVHNSVAPSLGELNNTHNKNSYVAVSQSGFFCAVAHEIAQNPTIFREAKR